MEEFFGRTVDRVEAALEGRVTFSFRCMQMFTCAFLMRKGTVAFRGFSDPEKVPVYLLVYRCENRLER